MPSAPASHGAKMAARRASWSARARSSGLFVETTIHQPIIARTGIERCSGVLACSPPVRRLKLGLQFRDEAILPLNLFCQRFEYHFIGGHCLRSSVHRVTVFIV